MKIRMGFVSNSSTSCFILIGHVFDKNDIDMEDLYEIAKKYSLGIEKGYGDGIPEGKVGIGSLSMVSDDEGFKEKPFNVVNIMQALDELGIDKMTMYTGICES